LRAMRRYVPVDLVKRLFAANEEPRLGAGREDVTVMFSDVEGFTSTAEKLEADRLATALGAYLASVAKGVGSTGGIVDKFMGDGVMALWNVPEAQDKHTISAVEAALRVREGHKALFASDAWKGLAAWKTRFGLHRDTVMVGHFGAPDRLSYTAMGDGVNLAARLEGANKLYGTEILVSASVKETVGKVFHLREIDRLAVKGKEQAVTVYEVLGRQGEVDDETFSVAAAYKEALELYYAGHFADALSAFETLPSDPPARAMAARCRALKGDPSAADDWDGVYRAPDK